MGKRNQLAEAKRDGGKNRLLREGIPETEQKNKGEGKGRGKLPSTRRGRRSNWER